MKIPTPFPNQTNYDVGQPERSADGALKSHDRGMLYNLPYHEADWGRLFNFVRGFQGTGHLFDKPLSHRAILIERFFRKPTSVDMGQVGLAVQSSRIHDYSPSSSFEEPYFDEEGNPLPAFKELDPELLVGCSEPLNLHSFPLSAEQKVLILSAVAKREKDFRATLQNVPVNNRKYSLLMVDRNFFKAHFSPIIPSGILPRLIDHLPRGFETDAKSIAISRIARAALFFALPFAAIEWGVRVLAEKVHVAYLRATGPADEAELARIRHKVNQYAPIAYCLNYQAADS